MRSFGFRVFRAGWYFRESGSPANAPVFVEGNVSAGGGSKKGVGVVEGALEEAEKTRAVLREENLELKGLVVDAANAVRKILHKAVSSDPGQSGICTFPTFFLPPFFFRW